MVRVDKVSNMHFERDVLQAASSPFVPNFHFTFQVSPIAILASLAISVNSSRHSFLILQNQAEKSLRTDLIQFLEFKWLQ